MKQNRSVNQNTSKGRNEVLYKLMLRKGYPESFASIIASEMNTEFTSGRMIGYIGSNGLMPLEEVADEMLAIISDRDRIRDKHISEHAQSQINVLYRSINEDSEDENINDEE